MPQLPRRTLVECFERKLHGRVDREDEHIHYVFELEGCVIAVTEISPPNKYRDFGDDILSRIARQLKVSLGRLKKSAYCDKDATSAILASWRSLLSSRTNRE